MNITCPHCGFAKHTDPARVPDRPVRITCPKCHEKFRFCKDEAAESAAPAEAAAPAPGNATNGPQEPPMERSTAAETAEPEPPPESAPINPKVRCSACGLEQPAADRCRGCGAAFVAAAEAAQQKFAGFWIRVVGALVDSVIVGVVQFVLTMVLTLFAAQAGGLLGQEAQMAMAGVTWLFGTAITWAYYVFFTGYCGQTPGKMAIRVKVVRTDGSDIGYVRSALREIPGKFISAILFGVGYLMVAFDNRKQGLHDKIADTYVIKL